MNGTVRGSCPASDLFLDVFTFWVWFLNTVMADSHIACRAHSVPLPCGLLIHTCHAAPLPCSDSAVSFVKVRVVAGNIRTVDQQFNRSSVL